ncbi:hypothetical protein AB5I41_23625 [Sphingomonas sp. MMS24-JH45]
MTAATRWIETESHADGGSIVNVHDIFGDVVLRRDSSIARTR